MCVVVGISIPPPLLSAFSYSKHRLHEKKPQLSTQIQTQLEINLY